MDGSLRYRCRGLSEYRRYWALKQEAIKTLALADRIIEAIKDLGYEVEFEYGDKKDLTK